MAMRSTKGHNFGFLRFVTMLFRYGYKIHQRSQFRFSQVALTHPRFPLDGHTSGGHFELVKLPSRWSCERWSSWPSIVLNIHFDGHSNANSSPSEPHDLET
ncbi:hypothetical protein RRG08_010181 [Elysia crispata]|uniref:Uncharacterized protein n=1 Tax=Elysia crispata TaxID=231223 RepID=A0AAE1AJL5_9GAST|nr:hypothetical protein RRG08_010181 [Elysia crispata]